MNGSQDRNFGRTWWFQMFLCAFPMLVTVTAMGQDSAYMSQEQHKFSFSFGQMFTFFFLMLGPLKILGPFVQLTRKGDAKFARRLAIRGFVISCVSLLLAAVIGENSLRKYDIREESSLR